MNKINKLLFLVLLFCFSCKTPPSEPSKELTSKASDTFSRQFLTYVIEYTLKESHFNKKPRENERPKAFLNIVDSSHNLLTEEDIKALDYDSLFESSSLNKNIFVISSSTKKKIDENISSIENLLSSTEISFKNVLKDETILLDRKNNRLKNKEELLNYWKGFFTYNVSLNYLDLLRKDEIEKLELTEDEKSKYILKEFIQSDKTLAKAKESSLKKITELLENRKKKTFADYFNYTINSMLHVYDIHSDYIPPSDQEDFSASLIGRMEGIGAILTKDEEFIKVVDVVPGGGAWNSKGLYKDDFILSVKDLKTSVKTNLKNKSVEDAVKVIKGPANTKIEMEIQDKNKKIKKIIITRGFVELAETYVKHTIIEFNNKKYGYIIVPKFYRDFDDPNARNCSDDVKYALEDFSKHKLEGVVLDLRNNGGGSLTDANKMTGLFIEEGPIVNVKDSSGNISTYYDQDHKIHYKGNLIVLVNKLSASASEIVASALQDYNRAIIVGSSQTYGKGTVQQLVSLAKDRYPMFSHYEFLNDNLGILKFTTNKFYRISGGTTQYNGVVSDIIIPDSFDYDDSLEMNREFSLRPDKIKKNDFKVFQDKKVFKNVISKFQKFINESEFRKISDELLRIRKETTLKVPKNISALKLFNEDKERGNKLNELTDKLDKIKFNYKVNVDEKLFFPNIPIKELSDPRFKEISEKKLNEFKEELEKDFVIHTSFLIFDELNK